MQVNKNVRQNYTEPFQRLEKTNLVHTEIKLVWQRFMTDWLKELK